MTEQQSSFSELADFVRVRRLRLDPGRCGLDVGTGRRRTAGLRREELGHLAGMSGDWIARLEQGRDIKLSRPAARRLAQALWYAYARTVDPVTGTDSRMKATA